MDPIYLSSPDVSVRLVERPLTWEDARQEIPLRVTAWRERRAFDFHRVRLFVRDNRRLLSLLGGPVLVGSTYAFLGLRAMLGLVVGLLVAALVTVTVLVVTGDAEEVGQIVRGRRRR